MPHISRRHTCAACALAVATFAAWPGDARAARPGRPRLRRPAEVRIEVPLGLQGVAGAGPNVVIPFTLLDATGLPTDVEAQFGTDRNADGTISDDEYVPATEDRLDPRNTRRNREPQNFVTAGGLGALHAFAWWSYADLGASRFLTLVYARTDQGRLLPDPDHPGEFLLAWPSGGVRVRIRAVARTRTGRLRPGRWAVSEVFSVDNTTPPSMTIDDVSPIAEGDAPADAFAVRWTAFDADSEDLDGNGRFDPLLGEDRNGDGRLGTVQVGVAFDFCRVADGTDPASMSADDLDALPWRPCTRRIGAGDTDSVREPPPAAGSPDERAFGSPSGRPWTFVWDVASDVEAADRGPFLLRGTCIDQAFATSETVFFRAAVRR